MFTHSAGRMGNKAGAHENQSKQLKEFQKDMDTSKHAAKAAQEDGKGGGDEGFGKNGGVVFCDGSSEHSGEGTGEGKNKGDGNGKFKNLLDGDNKNTADGDGDKKQKRSRDGPLVPETATGKTFYSVVRT